MSLTNNILNPPTISGKSFNKKFTVGLQDIKNGGAFTTVDIKLADLPIGSIVTLNRVKHSTAVAGTGFSAATARLKFNGTALGGAALDVFAAPGTTVDTHEKTGTTAVKGKLDDVTPLYMTVTSTGGDLSAATAGSIDAFVEWEVLN